MRSFPTLNGVRQKSSPGRRITCSGEGEGHMELLVCAKMVTRTDGFCPKVKEKLQQWEENMNSRK
jgi:hypothetical protein